MPTPASPPDHPSDAAPPGRLRLGPGPLVAALVVVLALFEAGNALIAPRLAPGDDDWRAAAGYVNAGFTAGDLVVAAPAWADPVLRLHLGQHLPIKVAARLDHEIFPRVWEVSQRGAAAPEAAGGQLVEERDFGRLRVRLYQRTPLPLRYDFADHWTAAQVYRVEGAAPPIACERQPAQHQCPGLAYNFVRPGLLEIGGHMHQALYAQPIAGATVVVEWKDVPLGRELAVGAGLHNVWLRKVGAGSVHLRVLVDGREVGAFDSGNRTGWKIGRFDTSALAGKTGTVRFEITSAEPYSRHFGFAAEARG